jgi:hypothetical protein
LPAAADGLNCKQKAQEIPFVGFLLSVAARPTMGAMTRALATLKPDPLPRQDLARWHALRVRYQAHLLSLNSNPMTPTFFDLSKIYPVTADLAVLLDQIDDLKKCLDSFRPLNPAQAGNLQGAWDIEYTYESNRIEGNTLTLQETGLVVSEGITAGGKRLHEHLAAINHQEAIGYIREFAAGQTELNAYQVNAIHALILRDIDPASPGQYSSVPVTISGARHAFPQPFLIQKLMEELFIFYSEQKDALHPVLLAAECTVGWSRSIPTPPNSPATAIGVIWSARKNGCLLKACALFLRETTL